jgi:hypothetical protein
MAIIAKASNLQSVNGHSIPSVTNWTDPNAPAEGDDYWVDTIQGEDVLRPWDKLVLGGNGASWTFPGLWQLEPKVSIGFDVAKILTNAGNSAATPPQPPEFDIRLTPKGYDPATINVTGEIWTAADWQTLKSLLPQVSPCKGNTSAPRAFDLTHPACNLLGIDQIIITSVGFPRIVDQTLTIQMTFLQYFPQGPIFINPYAHSGGPLIGPQVIAGNQVQKK